MSYKLDSGQKHFLRLIVSGEAADGWTRVSKFVMPTVEDTMPEELTELEVFEDGSGRVKLTPKGKQIVEAMDWL